ncbi:MAG: DUF3489 domain-containing protein [Henriciella sp.]
MTQTTTRTATSKARKPQATKPKPRPPRQTKIALLREVLEHEDGATLEALCDATDWQSHTVRAALSRLRKAGHEIDRAKSDAGTTTYRITASTKAQP